MVFFCLSAFLANTFLAYFVGWDRLIGWMTEPPTRHPAAFAVMLATTLLMFLDFAWFREQTCIVACPYGRFQSVLLDRHSLIVGYDTKPRRAPGASGAATSSGPPATASTAASASPPARPASTSATGSRWSASPAPSASTPATQVMDRIGLDAGPDPLHLPGGARDRRAAASCGPGW